MNVYFVRLQLLTIMRYRTIFLLMSIWGGLASARHSPRRLHKGEKIVNGQVVNIEDVPYQVGLRDSESDFFCGGAIVGRKVVFTAAHCVTVIPTSTPSPGVQVFAGAQRIGDPAAQIHDVQTIHVHPNWDYENLNYDFAVLILQTNLEYTNRIKPVPVTTKKIKVGKPVRLSGYGRNEYGVITGDLRVAMMMIVKRRNCQENLGDDLRMTKAMICLESEDGQSACNGDSGGPLTADGVLIGVTSFGTTRDCDNGQEVYSNIYYFLDFIKKVVPHVLL